MHRSWVVGLGLLLAAGCSTIRGVGPGADAQALLVLTPTEAARARTEGMALWARQPHEVSCATQAARLLEGAAQAVPDDYPTRIAAATVLAYLAEQAPEPTNRVQAAKRGIVLAREARALKPADAPGHYWYAINVGLLADVERAYGLNAVAEMEPALKRAAELDERYDEAGPLRVLALLHLRAPPPPVSIGSNRKALRLLQRAVELFPSDPENYLYLAEAQHAAGNLDEAEASLHKVLSASAPAGQAAEWAQWQQRARELQQQWHSHP